MVLEVDKSKLIDMRDSQSKSFKDIREEMVQINWQSQSAWFRLMLKTNATLRERFSDLLYGIELKGARRWEYPWAILSTDLEPGLCVLDAGCGGSPLPIYLAKRGYDCFATDPDIMNPLDPSKYKGIHKKCINVRRFIKHRMFRYFGGSLGDGYYNLATRHNVSITYKKESIQEMSFEDNFFDRVFCISVIEHVPKEEWSICIEQLMRVVRPGGKLIITLDIFYDDLHVYKDIIPYSSLKFLIDRDHSNVKYSDWPPELLETIGLVMTKEKE